MQQNMNLSMTPYNQAGAFVCSQYDIGRECQVKLTDESGDYTIPTGATVTVMATKPSGLGFSVECTWSGSTVTFATTETMTNEFGRFPAEIRIEKDGLLLGSTNFYFKVEKSPHPDEVIDGDVIIQKNLVARVTTLETKVAKAETDITDLKADIGDLEELETEDKSSLVNAINEAKSSGGSGITDDLWTAFMNAFNHVAWKGDTDGQTYITALEVARAESRGETVFTVTNVLDGFTNSNSATTVSAGASYTGTLTMVGTHAYSNVTVTMNGADVTSTAYNSSTGVVSIATVSGNIVITASAFDTVDTTAIIKFHDYSANDASQLEYKENAGFTIRYQLDEPTTTFYVAGVIVQDGITANNIGRICLYDSDNKLYGGYDENNRWAKAPASSYTEYKNSWTTTSAFNQISATVDERYLDESYLYDYTTGKVLFAGENTPYYGMGNIDETPATPIVLPTYAGLYPFDNIVFEKANTYKIEISNGNHVKFTRLMTSTAGAWLELSIVQRFANNGYINYMSNSSTRSNLKTIFTLPSDTEITLHIKNPTFTAGGQGSTSTLGMSVNLNPTGGSTAVLSTEIASLTAVEPASNSVTLAQDTEVNSVWMYAGAYSINDIIEFDVELYVGEERWV